MTTQTTACCFSELQSRFSGRHRWFLGFLQSKSVIRFTSSLTNSLAWPFHTPDVSIAIGVNRWVYRTFWYFCVLVIADLFAACQTAVAVAGWCDCAAMFNAFDLILRNRVKYISSSKSSMFHALHLILFNVQKRNRFTHERRHYFTH